MAKTIGIGYQNFADIISDGVFYIDKTDFIKEWWEAQDKVTLITRPRRFGKTLNMSMIESFFSVQYADKKELFEGLSIWSNEKYKKLQGTYPVISLSFANIKEKKYEHTVYQICQILMMEYEKYSYILEGDVLSDTEKQIFERNRCQLGEQDAVLSLYRLSDYLSRYYKKKVILLLDEYDTPMQEAYVNGYWDDMLGFTRSLFNSTFKTNPYIERAILTGITRISKASIFSDLNNMEVITVTSEKYETVFGFTEQEVFHAMEEYEVHTEEQKNKIKQWYDGFVFGKSKDIYNPWSIINYLDKGKVATYWANTSSNNLVGTLIKQGDKEIKMQFEQLMKGEELKIELDEEIVFDQLKKKKGAIWSLLLASGYLKVTKVEQQGNGGREKNIYTLSITNLEVEIMFEDLVREWFDEAGSDYNDFVKALLLNDIKSMNRYMNRVALTTFSYFDTGRKPSEAEPERFYHGFVLGLLVELRDRYMITSNRLSGFGRYDVMIEPIDKEKIAYIFEFKVQDSEEEKNLSETVNAALKQIEEQKYEILLTEHGIKKENIRKYGFAFCGQKVLIG